MYTKNYIQFFSPKIYKKNWMKINSVDTNWQILNLISYC